MSGSSEARSENAARGIPSEQIAAATRVRAFLDEIERLGLCGSGILFGIPGKDEQLHIGDLEILSARDSASNAAPPAMVCVGCGVPVGGIEPTQHAEGCNKPGTKLARREVDG